MSKMKTGYGEQEERQSAKEEDNGEEGWATVGKRGEGQLERPGREREKMRGRQGEGREKQRREGVSNMKIHVYGERRGLMEAASREGNCDYGSVYVRGKDVGL